MSILSKPVQVDEKEKEEFQGVAMLHVSRKALFAGALNLATGTLRNH